MMIGYSGGGDRFSDLAALLNGDTIENFGAPDNRLDVTNLAFSSLSGTFTENSGGTAGTLHLTDGVHTTSILLTGKLAAAGFSGSLAAAGFTVASDAHAGTLFGYSG